MENFIHENIFHDDPEEHNIEDLSEEHNCRCFQLKSDRLTRKKKFVAPRYDEAFFKGLELLDKYELKDIEELSNTKENQ
jgi:hypothetical protein